MLFAQKYHFSTDITKIALAAMFILGLNHTVYPTGDVVYQADVTSSDSAKNQILHYAMKVFGPVENRKPQKISFNVDLDFTKSTDPLEYLFNLLSNLKIQSYEADKAQITNQFASGQRGLQETFVVGLLASVVEALCIKTMDAKSSKTIKKVAALSGAVNSLKAALGIGGVLDKGLGSAIIDGYFASRDLKKGLNHKELAAMNKNEERSAWLDSKKRNLFIALGVSNLLRLIAFANGYSKKVTVTEKQFDGKTFYTSSGDSVTSDLTVMALANIIDLFVKHNRYKLEMQGLEKFKARQQLEVQQTAETEAPVAA